MTCPWPLRSLEKRTARQDPSDLFEGSTASTEMQSVPNPADGVHGYATWQPQGMGKRGKGSSATAAAADVAARRGSGKTATSPLKMLRVRVKRQTILPQSRQPLRRLRAAPPVPCQKSTQYPTTATAGTLRESAHVFVKDSARAQV